MIRYLITQLETLPVKVLQVKPSDYKNGADFLRRFYLDADPPHPESCSHIVGHARR